LYVNLKWFGHFRGEEKATLISPRMKDLSILGLGYTVGTPPDGITAPVLVVSSFEELQQRANEVANFFIINSRTP